MRRTKEEMQKDVNREALYKKLCIILAICVVGTLLYFNLEDNSKNSEPVFIENTAESEDDISAPILIHIKGEVLKPGLYEVSGDFRLKDAIDAAGGLTQNANTDALNLAMFITDGDEIIIPPVGSDASVIVSSGASRGDSTDSKKLNLRVNINTASVEQLTQLPGIGKSLAEQIIQFRTHIPFTQISDLKSVPGIGNSKFDEIRDYIYVK